MPNSPCSFERRWAFRQRSAQRLVRSTDRAVLAGVCAGVGRRLGLTPWVTRALFVLTLFVIPGSQILVYPLLWFLMPSEDGLEAATATSYPTR